MIFGIVRIPHHAIPKTRQAVGQRVVDLSRSLVLSYEPNGDQLDVEIIPEQNVKWSVNGNKMSFNPGLQPGTEVRVSYSYGFDL